MCPNDDMVSSTGIDAVGGVATLDAAQPNGYTRDILALVVVKSAPVMFG